MGVTCNASIGQLPFDSSIIEFRFRATKTILSASPLARIITGLINLFPFGCSSLLTGKKIS